MKFASQPEPRAGEGAQPDLTTEHVQILAKDHITCFGRIDPVLLSSDQKRSAAHVYIVL
jgi:hypothetical protein